jgi:hypothetical protein
VSDANQVWRGTGVAEPEYPDGRRLAPGKCTRGWITFALSGGQKPAAVEYAPAPSDGEEAPVVSWRIK